MLWIIISFICAALILYKLFSVIGYHDESEDLKRKIKDIQNLQEEIKNNESTINQNYQITKNSEEDDKIFRNLNLELQNTLSKIFELDSDFHLSSFIQHCDLFFTKIFEELKSETFTTLQELCNEKSLDKFKEIIKSKKFTKTLIKIEKIIIEAININENQECVISIQISSNQMIPNNNNEFIYKAETSNLSMGKSFQNKEDPKWILIDFDNI